MIIEFKRFPCSKCGGTKMLIDKQRCFTGFRYRLFCDNCKSFVQWANPEQKMIINAAFDYQEAKLKLNSLYGKEVMNDQNHITY